MFNTDLIRLQTFLFNSTWPCSYEFLSLKIIISFCQNYSADIGELTKTNPEIAVNEWINKQTRGKIPKIVGEKNCLVADNLRNNDNIMC